ncbi:GPO family capsid scaffolding protein [Photobacterium sp. 1_MG-2023]|uniref:GPO family capsid scaffolding protein n=1 Tax=Photobacterium sp. 1_MG-2023 TaxID=3062646 RepID=UPI0026E1276E|nr:GPO family capsid scaffolding protein [Photobacterium sp. 1_MG-2023]MDO6706153.1 GPO family capsid scaffolding protein [Photobacterium sp. 1_MG-2023]
MAKTSDWKIIATEGATVDGRKLLRQWFKEMAEQYSTQEYTAMIWPEHFRFGGFGDNWGTVEAVKAEELNGKMRLFAKIKPNQYLLTANKLGQKLFTSIEINPDYKGEGRCYLRGLAVTDSPASTGTSRLEFSEQSGQVKAIECDQLEELDFAECQPNALVQAISTLFTHFQSGNPTSETQPEPESEDTDVTPEQLKAALKEQFSTMKTELKTELEESLTAKFSQNQQVDEAAEGDDAGKDNLTEIQNFSAESFTKALQDGLKPLTDKVDGLEQKFAALNVEADGQRPAGEGSDADKMEVF